MARIIRSAVAGSSVIVTSWVRINHSARSGLNTVSASDTTGTPYHHAGTRMSMIPAIQAQSAGDQMTSSGCG